MKFQSVTFEEKQRDFNKNTYEVKRIDIRDIERSSEFKEEYYKEYWGSKETFLNSGFGFCIEQDGIIVAECVSIFSGHGFAEIDIATHGAHQGKGLAQAVATRFIEHCMQNDIIPSWDCYVDNIPSGKLASKLNFYHPIEYSLFVRKKTGNKMNVELTRFKVKPGKSHRVDEWMQLLNDNMKEVLLTLNDEKMYVETIFREIRDGKEYLYWYSVQGKGGTHVENSHHEIDKST